MHFSLPACVFDMLKQSTLVPAVLTERIRQHVPAKQLVICRPSLSKNAEPITLHWNLTNGRRWNLISSQQTTPKTISKQTETCTVMQWNKHKDLDMYILCLYVHNHTRCACAYNRYVAHYERWPVWRIFCLNFEPSFQNFVELLGPRDRTNTRYYYNTEWCGQTTTPRVRFEPTISVPERQTTSGQCDRPLICHCTNARNI